MALNTAERVCVVMVCKSDKQKNSLVQEHAKEVTEKVGNSAFRT